VERHSFAFDAENLLKFHYLTWIFGRIQAMKNPQNQNLESVWDLQAGGPSQDLSLLTYLLILFVYHDVYNEEK